MSGRDSSVGIATGYGLDGPEIESRWGEIFHTRANRPWSAAGGKATGAWRWPPTPSSAKVKERVEL
jgi:hypothetical protein